MLKTGIILFQFTNCSKTQACLTFNAACCWNECTQQHSELYGIKLKASLIIKLANNV